MTKYILVTWPDSQKYINDPECLPCGSIGEYDDNFNGAYFVPEHLL